MRTTRAARTVVLIPGVRAGTISALAARHIRPGRGNEGADGGRCEVKALNAQEVSDQETRDTEIEGRSREAARRRDRDGRRGSGEMEEEGLPRDAGAWIGAALFAVA
jgi:hypothetical protein